MKMAAMLMWCAGLLLVEWFQREQHDMANHNDHEPAKSDGRVHVTEHGIAFPNLHMEKAVAHQVADVGPSRLGCH